MAEAVDKQSAPRGTGRDITELAKVDVLQAGFMYPEKGVETIELWMRSAALYLKVRLSKDPGIALTPYGQVPDMLKVAQALIRDLEERAATGEKKYGERLRAFNGRDPLVDLYQECMDGWMYARQAREEKENPG